MKKFLILIIVGVYATMSWGQTMTAEVDNTLVEYGDVVNISFTINSQEASDFTPPPFTNFKVVGGPSQSSNYQNINGRQTRSFVISYALQPKHLGRLNIGVGKVVVNKKTIKSKPLFVTVKKGIVRDFYVQLEVNDSSIYVGQQFVLEYVLYTQADISNYNKLEEQDFDGFFHKAYRTREQAQSVVVKGKPYTRQVMEREILYPQRKGQFTFGPTKIRLGLTDKSKNNNNRGMFFSVKSTIPKDVITNEILVNVKKLPKTSKDFSGAVGSFEIFSSINKTTLRQNEALSVFVTIRGNGDIKNVMPPSLDLEDGFDVFDAKVKEESSKMNGNKETSKKVFEYVVIPKKQGKPIVQPAFTYFDTDSLKYITKRSRPFRLNILAGDVSGIVNVEDNSDVFTPLAKTFTPVSFNFWNNNPLTAVLCFFPFFLIGGMWGFDKWNKEKEPERAKLHTQSNASKKAKSFMVDAQKHLENNQPKAFYSEVAKSLRRFIEDKFDIKATTLAKSKISEALTSKSVNIEIVNELEKMLSDCEMGQFGMSNVDAPDAFFKKALALLDKF